jgi:hypothetical protein
MLGHASASMTLESYADPFDADASRGGADPVQDGDPVKGITAAQKS